MKEGWTYKKLGDIAVSMADGPFGSNLKAEHYTQNREVRIIQLSNIGEEGWRDENKKYTTYNHLETIKRSEVCPGDIVIAKMMPAGRAVICPNIDSKYVLSSDAVRVTLKEKIDHKFIYYAINSPYFRKQVYENVSGSGRVRTSLTKLKDCVIGTPTFSEQKRIVSRLDAAFSHIDELKANAEKQLTEARALFQRSLAKAMEPKEGWKEKRLPDISENLDSKRVPVTKKDRENGIYPYYGASGIVDYVNDYLFDEDLLCISEDGANLLMRTYPIAFPISGKVWVNNHAHVLRFKDMSTQKFIEYYFSGIKLDEFITGAAQPKLTQKALNNIPVYIPSLHEQQRIVERLDALSAHVRELEENQKKIISECDALKQALLRKVFE